MNQSEFRQAVWAGLGRAILYAQANDVREFRDIILDACLHCYSIDVQSEGTRAPYMLELVNLTSDPEFYCGEVLKALPGGGDDWDAVQRFRFACYMAMDGDDRARQAVYENFNPGPRNAEEMGIDLVDLDGLDGFLFAAAKLGELLINKTSLAVKDSWLLAHAIETLGEMQTLDALKEGGKTNPRVEAYRVAAEAGKDQPDVGMRRINEIRAMAYAELKSKLPELRGYRLVDWGAHTNERDLELAARDLLMARTSDEQLTLLRIFRRRTFPLPHDRLLQLAASDEPRVAESAAEALANVNHPSVRELAFQLVQTRHAGRERAVSMLATNWKLGDHEIVLGWFEMEEDRDARHRLGIDLRSFWERHPEAATESQMLLSLYERGPCSECRGFLLPRLIKLDSLPASIRAECAFDANQDVRQLVLDFAQ
jgi:hypothetical protein